MTEVNAFPETVAFKVKPVPDPPVGCIPEYEPLVYPDPPVIDVDVMVLKSKLKFL